MSNLSLVMLRPEPLPLSLLSNNSRCLNHSVLNHASPIVSSLKVLHLLPKLVADGRKKAPLVLGEAIGKGLSTRPSQTTKCNRVPVLSLRLS
jgi:hypothetical protein